MLHSLGFHGKVVVVVSILFCRTPMSPGASFPTLCTSERFEVSPWKLITWMKHHEIFILSLSSGHGTASLLYLIHVSTANYYTYQIILLFHSFIHSFIYSLDIYGESLWAWQWSGEYLRRSASEQRAFRDQEFSGRETASNTTAAMKPGLGRTLGLVLGSRAQSGAQCG